MNTAWSAIHRKARYKGLHACSLSAGEAEAGGSLGLANVARLSKRLHLRNQVDGLAKVQRAKAFLPSLMISRTHSGQNRLPEVLQALHTCTMVQMCLWPCMYRYKHKSMGNEIGSNRGRHTFICTYACVHTNSLKRQERRWTPPQGHEQT